MDQVRPVKSYSELEDAPTPPTGEQPRSFMQWVLISYRQHWILILILTLIAALAGTVFTFVKYKPTYTASTQVFVGAKKSQTANLGLMTTVAGLYTSYEALDYANTRMGQEHSLAELQSATVCVPRAGSLIMTCSVTLPSESQARRYLTLIVEKGKVISQRECQNVVIGRLNQVISVRRASAPYARNISASTGGMLFLLLVIVPFFPVRVRKVSKHEAGIH
jgi:capsular polysaccharide biosynthesis protein